MEDEEEISPEKKKKRESIKRKAKELMTEMAEEMVDDELIEISDRKVKELLKEASVPFSLTTLKAFQQGFGFSLAIAMDSDGIKLATLICACLEMQVKSMKKSTVNPEIDSIINKSMNNPTIKPEKDAS